MAQRRRALCFVAQQTLDPLTASVRAGGTSIWFVERSGTHRGAARRPLCRPLPGQRLPVALRTFFPLYPCRWLFLTNRPAEGFSAVARVPGCSPSLSVRRSASWAAASLAVRPMRFYTSHRVIPPAWFKRLQFFLESGFEKTCCIPNPRRLKPGAVSCCYDLVNRL